MAAAVVQLTSFAKDKFISPVPTNAISDLTAFDSKERVEGQVRAIYASIIGLANGAVLKGEPTPANPKTGPSTITIVTPTAAGRVTTPALTNA